MCAVKPKKGSQEEILRCEAEINNLWGELNTSNIPHNKRMEIEKVLSGCEEQFKEVLNGKNSFEKLQTKLDEVDFALSLSAVEKAIDEVPKTERTGSIYLALEHVRQQLVEKIITPSHARHEIKDVVRRHNG